MASLIAEGEVDVVFGSRILGVGALEGRMPLWYKYWSNHFLTLVKTSFWSQAFFRYTIPKSGPWSQEGLEKLPLLRS